MSVPERRPALAADLTLRSKYAPGEETLAHPKNEDALDAPHVPDIVVPSAQPSSPHSATVLAAAASPASTPPGSLGPTDATVVGAVVPRTHRPLLHVAPPAPPPAAAAPFSRALPWWLFGLFLVLSAIVAGFTFHRRTALPPTEGPAEAWTAVPVAPSPVPAPLPVDPPVPVPSPLEPAPLVTSGLSGTSALAPPGSAPPPSRRARPAHSPSPATPRPRGEASTSGPALLDWEGKPKDR